MMNKQDCKIMMHCNSTKPTIKIIEHDGILWLWHIQQEIATADMGMVTTKQGNKALVYNTVLFES